MSVEKGLNSFDEADMFDKIVEELQSESNEKNNVNSSKTSQIIKSKNKTMTLAQKYSRKKTGKIIGIDEYVKRAQNKRSLNKKENIKNKKKILNLEKSKEEKKIEKNKKKKIAQISKQIEANIARKTRFTEPKKRNILSRLILQYELSEDGFAYIEDNYDSYSQQEINKSKNGKNKSDRKLYKEVQKYEDARDDASVRKGWVAFKVGLATAMLASSLALANYVTDEVKASFDSGFGNSNNSIESISEEERDYYKGITEKFTNNVKENDGYEFDHLTSEELLNGYLRIINREKKMIDATFRSAFYNSKDQDLLNDIVEKSFGEDVYNTFTDTQKRDYRQLAFELLPLSQPKVFGENNFYIRNPIVYDALQAKNKAKENGYNIELIVNSDEKETVKTIGNLIHIQNTMQENNLREASQANGGQNLLEEIVKQALNDKYEMLSKRDKRDYKQIAYELLSSNAKQYIKDPIDIEKATADMEIGE